MNHSDYMDGARRTLPDLPEREMLAMLSLGLAGEAGEIVELLKKHLFHGHELPIADFAKEAGDLCWYLFLLLDQFGISLEDVEEVNHVKLKKRYPDGFSSTASQARTE